MSLISCSHRHHSLSPCISDTAFRRHSHTLSLSSPNYRASYPWRSRRCHCRDLQGILCWLLRLLKSISVVNRACGNFLLRSRNSIDFCPQKKSVQQSTVRQLSVKIGLAYICLSWCSNRSCRWRQNLNILARLNHRSSRHCWSTRSELWTQMMSNQRRINSIKDLHVRPALATRMCEHI